MVLKEEFFREESKLNKYDQAHNKKHFTRVNFQIRVPNVRVVQDGKQLGVMPTDKARLLAQDAGLDLVEVAPQAQPPVCHIIEYDKYRYMQKQKEKEQARKQKESAQELKELRLRPGIQDHDIETKANTARKFLEEGKKVQLNLQFKNREITHKDEGFKVMDKIIKSLVDVATVERQPKMEGFKLICRLEPKANDS